MSRQDVVRLTDEAPRWVPDNGDESDSKPTATWPAPLDLREMAQREPHPPRWIVQDWMPAGYATLLAGHGGAGKSAIAKHLAVCIGRGLPWMGVPVQQRRVLYVSCEDREDVLHWRLTRICAHLDVPLADLAGHLDVIDLVGHDAVLWTAKALNTREPLPAMAALRERAAESQAEVIMIDGISDTYGGSEIARAEVRAYIAGLLALVDAQRGALLLVGHVNKLTAAINSNTSDGYSGSTAWHNSVRARWYLRPETRNDEDAERTGDLILDLQKSNLGRTDHSMRIAWDEDAQTFTGRTITSETALDRASRERRERNGIMDALRAVVASGDYVPAATTGRRTAYHVLAAHPDFPDSMRAGKPGRDRFWRLVEGLRQMGEIRESSIRRESRHKTAVLMPADTEETKVCGDAANE